MKILGILAAFAIGVAFFFVVGLGFFINLIYCVP